LIKELYDDQRRFADPDAQRCVRDIPLATRGQCIRQGRSTCKSSGQRGPVAVRGHGREHWLRNVRNNVDGRTEERRKSGKPVVGFG